MKKRVLAMLLASAMVAGSLAGCGGSSDKPEASTEDGKETAEEGSAAPEWEAYDELIANIKKETDLVKREAMMHEAEDMLMDTWAVVPLYYYNDVYMQSTDVEGIYAPLDEANVIRFSTYLTRIDTTQFIVITHRKPTMTICNALYGVAMEEKGVSKLVSVKLN